MVRILGSHNSKCLDKISEVKVIQQWDRYRPKINLPLGSFYACLVNQRIVTRKNERKGEMCIPLNAMEVLIFCGYAPE